MRFDSHAIAAATGGRVIRPGPPGPINANHQTMEPGEWFIALTGEGFDDHPFLPEAEQRGAAGVILERELEGLVGPAVQVAHAWTAIGDLGLVARRAFHGPVVGVTGSTGNTTTGVLIRHALSPLGATHPPADHVNHQPGLSLALLACPEDVAAQVLELGARLPGGMTEMATVVEPDVRVVVSVGPAHLEHLGDLAGVAREKRVLLDLARPRDVAVVNGADPMVRAMEVPTGVERIAYGPEEAFALVDAVPAETGLRATWRTPTGTVGAVLATRARFVAENAAAALAVAWSQGVSMKDAAAALRRFRPLGSRLREVVLPGGTTLLDDAFNANPTSMAAALRVLVRQPGRHVAVLGDMGELGARSRPLHEEIVGLAEALGIERLVLVGPRMAEVAPPGARVVDDAAAALGALRELMNDGDVVLVKGSRSMRLERVAQGLEGVTTDPS